MAFLTYSQVELILYCKGFWHNAWIWLISWVRFSLRKSKGRIQPLTFGFQSAMKNKDIFSQDNGVISITSSCFGFLEEMNLQVSFYKRISFSQLSFLLLCAIINECMCKLGEGRWQGEGRGRYPCQCFRYQSWNSKFLILPFQRSPQNWSRQSKSFPSTRSPAETFPHFLLLGLCYPLSKDHFEPKPITLKKTEHAWVEHSLIWPSPSL